MTPLSCEVVTTGMTEVEFAQALESLDQMMSCIQDNLKKMAALFGRMSSVQLKKAKNRLKGFLARDHIERLSMFGRGQIAWHLAEPTKMIPSYQLKLLSVSALKILNNPDASLQIASSTGVKVKMVSQATSVELSQVLGPKGILKPEDQVKQLLGYCAKQKKLDAMAEAADTYGGLQMLSDGLTVIIWGHSKDAEYSSKIRVPLKELRRILR